MTFKPFDVVVELAASRGTVTADAAKEDMAATGESVFHAGARSGVLIPTACGGKGTCGLCRVKILEGEKALGPITVEEKRHLGNTYFISKLRLSCRLHPTGDIVVEIPGAKVTLPSG